VFDSGLMAGSNIDANYTLTMGFPKIGHFFNNGLDSSGELHVLDIGFKPLSKSHASMKLIDHGDLCGQYPSYSENVHKFSRGKLVTISGSKGYTGACILAIQAAMKTGVGIIKAIIPESLNNIFESSLISAISIPIQEHKTGTFTSENTNDILDETIWADAVIFEPRICIYF
jgi:NAD(P)H-hydrate epimerase